MAYTPESSFTFNSSTNTIKAFIGSETVIDIPPTIGGVNVTAIGNTCFSGKSLITSVIIPSGVFSIGSQAFYNCTSLASITLPETLLTISTSVFYRCLSLTSITLPNSLIGLSNGAFALCTSLSSISIPANITNINSDMFSGCTSLAAVTLPSTLISIDSSSFYNCTSLASISLPSSLESINSNAFANCSLLTSITLPNSVSSLGDGLFSGCTSLTSITFPNTITNINSLMFFMCTSLESIVIPNTVTTISDNAFGSCSSLTSVTLPEGLETIDDYSFSLCTSLSSITLPESLVSINTESFKGSGLTSITIPDSVTHIGSYCFYLCDKLVTAVLPNSEDIFLGNCAFRGCILLTTINIPTTTSIIPIEFLAECPSLESITIPSNITEIGGYSFFATGLINLVIPNTVTIMGTGAFQRCVNLTSISISTSLTTLSSQIFQECSSLEYIYIPNNITSIESQAFDSCLSLTTIRLPEFLTSIGYTVFKSCVNINSLSLPDGVISIGYDAFYDCSGLTNIIIPSGVTSLGSSTFSGCSLLSSITLKAESVVDKENSTLNGVNPTTIYVPLDVVDAYKSSSDWLDYADIIFPISQYSPEEDFIFYSGSNTVAQYIGTSTAVYVPPSFTINGEIFVAKNIGTACFQGKTNITNIILPNSILSVEDLAFMSCSSLENIIIPSSVLTLGNNIFYGCSSLDTVIVDGNNPNYSSEDGVLYNKTKTILILFPSGRTDTSYSIPYNLSYIKEGAFNTCSNLLSLTLYDTTPATIDVNSFVDYNIDFKIKVSTTYVNTYKTAWPSLSSIIFPYYINEADFVMTGSTITSYIGSETEELTVPSSINAVSVTGIAATTFNTNFSFKRIILPETLSTVEAATFRNCVNLTSISVLSSNTYLSTDGGILYNKTKTNIICYPQAILSNTFTIPATVTAITNYCFENCENLMIVSGVKTLSIGAFKNSGIMTITVTNSITSIPNYCFADCSDLVSINYTGALATIGIQSFYNCSSLLMFNIPDTVTAIGANAFDGCLSLKRMDVSPVVPPTLGANAFENMYPYFRVMVLHSVNTYKTAWSAYSSIIFGYEPILPDFLTTQDFIDLVPDVDFINGNKTVKTIKLLKVNFTDTQCKFTIDNRLKNNNDLLNVSSLCVKKIINKDNR